MCFACTSQYANHTEISSGGLVADSAFHPLNDTSSTKTVPRVFKSTQCTAAVAAYLRGEEIAGCLLDIAELICPCSGDEGELQFGWHAYFI